MSKTANVEETLSATAFGWRKKVGVASLLIMLLALGYWGASFKGEASTPLRGEVDSFQYERFAAMDFKVRAQDALIYQFFQTPGYKPVGNIQRLAAKIEGLIVGAIEVADVDQVKLLEIIRGEKALYIEIFSDDITPNLRKREEDIRGLFRVAAPEAKKLVSNLLMLAQKNDKDRVVEYAGRLMRHLLSAQVSAYSYILTHDPGERAGAELELMAAKNACSDLEADDLTAREREMLEGAVGLLGEIEGRFQSIVSINEGVEVLITQSLTLHSDKIRATVGRLMDSLGRLEHEKMGLTL